MGQNQTKSFYYAIITSNYDVKRWGRKAVAIASRDWFFVIGFSISSAIIRPVFGKESF